jgi:hypothetical protein
MNKRIKELIDQTDQSGIPYQACDSLMTITDRYLEYFAELIVQECMGVNSTLLGHNTCKNLHNLYEEHFGVEE